MSSTGDVDVWLERLSEGKLPGEEDICKICERVIEVFTKEENVVKVQTPVTIVGDLHGQFYDLKEIFRVGGDCPEANYLFLGDYVDRGYFSVETILLLLVMKIRYPSRVTMIRGNHETRQITQVYGFYDECMKKFGSSKIWTACTNVFDCIPLAAVVEDAGIFGVHAGLSPSLNSIDMIGLLDRRVEVPHEGPMCDLLWSDPDDVAGWGVSQRGAGYIFGEDVVQEFIHTNNLKMVARSHQLVLEGYKEMFGGALVTIWSAPNYCYRCGNDAAIMTFENATEKHYSVFSAAPNGVRDRPKGFKVDEIPTPDYFM